MGETKKITQIKAELQAAEESMLPSFILEYEMDARAGVVVPGGTGKEAVAGVGGREGADREA